MQENRQQQGLATDANTDKLLECYRHELSATETYELALKSVTHVGLHHALQDLLVSHSRRSDQLRESIRRQGGEAPTSSGIWGAFAKVVQIGADMLGDRLAIGALEQGEDRGLMLYAEALSVCDPSTRTLIATELLPEQQRTHGICRTLKHFVNEPS